MRTTLQGYFPRPEVTWRAHGEWGLCFDTLPETQGISLQPSHSHTSRYTQVVDRLGLWSMTPIQATGGPSQPPTDGSLYLRWLPSKLMVRVCFPHRFREIIVHRSCRTVAKDWLIYLEERCNYFKMSIFTIYQKSYHFELFKLVMKNIRYSLKMCEGVPSF